MAEPQEIAGIIKGIQADVRTIVQGEIELVKAELVPQAKAAGLGAGLIGGAIFLVAIAGASFFLAMAFLISFAFMAWFALPVLPALVWGFVIMAVLLILLAGGLALVARKKMVFNKPQASINQAQETKETVTGAIQGAAREAGALSLTGKPSHPELE